MIEAISLPGPNASIEFPPCYSIKAWRKTASGQHAFAPSVRYRCCNQCPISPQRKPAFRRSCLSDVNGPYRHSRALPTPQRSFPRSAIHASCSIRARTKVGKRTNLLFAATDKGEAFENDATCEGSVERDRRLSAAIDVQREHIRASIVATGVELPPRRSCGADIDVRDQEALFPMQRSGVEAAEWLVDGRVAGVHPLVLVRKQLFIMRDVGRDVRCFK